MTSTSGPILHTTAAPQSDFDPAVRQLPDSELLLLARDGRRSAAVELWRRHTAYTMAVAHGLAPDDDWESINTRAWSLVLDPAADDRAAGGFRPYVYFMIRALSSVEETAPRREDFLTAAYHDLPPRWHETLWYAHIESMRPARIARFMGLDPDSMPQLLHRARQGLRQEWVRHHIGAIDDDSDCRLVWEYSGAYIRGVLTTQERTWMESHLATCRVCRHAASDAVTVASHLPTIVLPTIAGANGAANLMDYLRTNGPAVRSSLDLPDAVEQLFGNHRWSGSNTPAEQEAGEPGSTMFASDIGSSDDGTASPHAPATTRPMARPARLEQLVRHATASTDVGGTDRDDQPIQAVNPPDDAHTPLSDAMDAVSRSDRPLTAPVDRGLDQPTLNRPPRLSEPGRPRTDTGHPDLGPSARPVSSPSDRLDHDDLSRPVPASLDAAVADDDVDEPDMDELRAANQSAPTDPHAVNRLVGSSEDLTQPTGRARRLSARWVVVGATILIVAAASVIGVTRPWDTGPAAPATSSTSEAAPVQITAVDTGADNTLLPVVTGMAPPNTDVSVHIGDVAVNLTSGDDGVWTTDGQTISSGLTRGQITASSASTTELATAVYQIAEPPTLTSDPDDPAIVTLTGSPAATVEVLADGNSAATVTLDPAGVTTTTVALTPGNHFLQARYLVAPRFGPSSEAVTIVVG